MLLLLLVSWMPLLLFHGLTRSLFGKIQGSLLNEYNRNLCLESYLQLLVGISVVILWLLCYFVFCSDFPEIFDVDWYISSLSKDVKIIKSLPKRGGKTWIPRNMRVPRKCSERCYQNRILPVLLKRHVSSPFSATFFWLLLYFTIFYHAILSCRVLLVYVCILASLVLQLHQ
jgi:succinate dehydrogenase hydrophobic anchor subunit